MPHPTQLGTVLLSSLSDTDRLGELIADYLPPVSVVAFVGTLGAGKTRLAQSIAKAIGVPEEAATSPTFTLIQPYHGSRAGSPQHINHVDAYRVNDLDEFLELGIEEAMEEPATWTLIEWADRVEDCMPPDTLWLCFELEDEVRRSVAFSGDPSVWENVLARITPQFVDSDN